MMAERGVLVGHATVHRWALKILPVLAAVRGLIARSGVAVELRQSKYLNNLVEQDHRAIKRRTRQLMGFKSFRSAVRFIAGSETMHMVKEGSWNAQAAWPFRQPTASTAWPPRRLLDGTALPRLVGLIATDPARGSATPHLPSEVTGVSHKATFSRPPI
jgi:transposase-like protein